MMKRAIALGSVTLFLVAMLGCQGQFAQKKYRWAVHDMNRPQPKIVTPGDQPGQPPSDAIVLFDGTDLSNWLNSKNQLAGWKVENGYMQVVPKTGTIQTKQAFGDCQLHVEWASPAVVEGEGQHRGNSGVFLMGKYEVQVLDSYESKTYPDGQAGAIYGQSPPLVNVCRKPGQWQTYDIVFRRPLFDKNGKVTRPARITVFQNGVLIQDNFELAGETFHKKRAFYKAHADKLPLILQDHHNPVRYRNIWIRELPDLEQN